MTDGFQGHEKPEPASASSGIQRDIDIVLRYTPNKPLCIIMHDGFNPECGKGMQEAN